jgi:hypothetical protein
MVTGRKAFEGKSQASLISAIMSSQPPLMAELQPMTPAALDHLPCQGPGGALAKRSRFEARAGVGGEWA